MTKSRYFVKASDLGILVSEWLFSKGQIRYFTAISWREEVTFTGMIISAVCYANMLKMIFIVLAHWISSLRVDMSVHILLIPSQPVFCFYCLALRNYHRISIYQFHGVVCPNQDLNPRSTALEASTLTSTASMTLPGLECMIYRARSRAH